MAQPPGLPEQLIAGAPDAFFGSFLDAWGTAPFEPDVRAAYLKPRRNAIPSIVADYRATATIDLEHDRPTGPPAARSRCPWPSSSRTGAFPAAELWQPWAPDLTHQTVTCGHFMAEAAPELITDVLRTLRRTTYHHDARNAGRAAATGAFQVGVPTGSISVSIASTSGTRTRSPSATISTAKRGSKPAASGCSARPSRRCEGTPPASSPASSPPGAPMSR